MNGEQTVFARWIVPVCQPPIQGGYVTISAGRVVDLGAGRPAGAIDLDDHAILPGLVNAHCHLEFSDLTTPIGKPGNGLHDWIGDVVQHRRARTHWQPDEVVRQGATESRKGGASLVCDIASAELAEKFPSSYQPPLDLIVMPEVLGLEKTRSAATFNAARNAIAIRLGDHCQWGISPHAPYSVFPDVIDACTELAEQFDLPLAMHVAESPDETALCMTARGPFRDTFVRLGMWPAAGFPTGLSQSELLKRLCQAPRALIIHGNYLDDPSRNVLERAPHSTVVYCPRTHAYFGHPRHPLADLLNRNVRVAIGTDSRASNPDLSMWRELQFLWRQRTDIPPQQLLHCATLAGAEAFGRSDLGQIQPGVRSELLCLPTRARTVDSLFADLAATAAVPAWLAEILPTA